MIGANDLGCEFAKSMALMGLGCGQTGSITITDHEYIESLNYKRRYFFCPPDLGSSKSATACNKAKMINPDLNFMANDVFVGPETENVFNDEFWEGLDFVINAVANTKARLYVDNQCVWYEKPLLESCTLGIKANS